MVQAKVFKVSKIFNGEIKDGDLTLEEEELPPLQDGEYLLETLFLSMDPYLRAIAPHYQIGQVMPGLQLAKVTQSKNTKHPKGEILATNCGWRTHTIIPADFAGTVPDFYPISAVGDLHNTPVSALLGVVGMPGVTAHRGFLDLCQPKEGETVIVSGAAGAVGQIVGQIAKNMGCRVIGITGSEEKAAWLESIGFDYVVNYKKEKNLEAALKKGCPNGADCYFDNVGGEISSTILHMMKKGGRVAVCGSISNYNSPARANVVQHAIVAKELTLRGFQASSFANKWIETLQKNLEWVQQKKLKFRETVTDGFENAPKALREMLRGGNIGKALVRVSGHHVDNESVDFINARKRFQNLAK